MSRLKWVYNVCPLVFEFSVKYTCITDKTFFFFFFFFFFNFLGLNFVAGLFGTLRIKHGGVSASLVIYQLLLQAKSKQGLV